MEKINQDLSSTGVLSQYFTDEITGKLITHTSQDLGPSLEYAKSLKSDAYWHSGVKKSFAHAAHIPEVAIVKLKQLGIDIFDPNTTARQIIGGMKKLEMGHFVFRENA